MRPPRPVLTILCCSALALMPAARAAALQGTTSLVSVNSEEVQGDDSSEAAAISGVGQEIAFASAARNLVPDDTNYVPDVFVRDRNDGTTERVSVSSDGGQGDNYSLNPATSLDGQIVSFESFAENLVPGDTNFEYDVFVHDRQTGVTERVSVSSAGAQGDGPSVNSALSSDGRYVAFESWAENLVPGDTNDAADIFVHDRETGQTERVSVSSSGAQSNAESYFPDISDDARYVAFYSYGSNLAPGDVNRDTDVFLHDRDTGTTELISVSSSEVQGRLGSHTPSLSADARFVAFSSYASNLAPRDRNGQPDVFVRDRVRGTTTMISVSSGQVQGNWHSVWPSISADGRFVAFESYASNLVPDDHNGLEDIFVRDRLARTTTLVSRSTEGVQGNLPSHEPAISADGLHVAFDSESNNLVPNDTNHLYDVFVHDR